MQNIALAEAWTMQACTKVVNDETVYKDGTEELE